MMGMTELVRKTRSIRRFKEDQQISRNQLRELVNLGRLSASANNLQPLRYIISAEAEKNEQIFPALSWAGKLENWDRPSQGRRPSAYIVILGDPGISNYLEYDCGIACQSILFGAREKGFGGCIMGALDREQLAETLDINDQYEILITLALGYPAEEVEIDNVSGGDLSYFRDDRDVHHVPKLQLDEVILKEH